MEETKTETKLLVKPWLLRKGKPFQAITAIDAGGDEIAVQETDRCFRWHHRTAVFETEIQAALSVGKVTPGWYIVENYNDRLEIREGIQKFTERFGVEMFDKITGKRARAKRVFHTEAKAQEAVVRNLNAILRALEKEAARIKKLISAAKQGKPVSLRSRTDYSRASFSVYYDRKDQIR